MLELQLVKTDVFEETKCSQKLLDIDPQFNGLIHRMNTLPFAYTFESCYGKFDYTSKPENHVLRKRGPGWIYCFFEGFVNFGLDYVYEAKKFLEDINNLRERNKGYTHLECRHSEEGEESRLGPNRYHFGILSVTQEGITQHSDVTITFESFEKAREFELIRDQIWRELDEVIKSYAT